MYNEKLSDFRRALYGKLKTDSDKEPLKGTWWLLLKNPDNLNADSDEHSCISKALELEKPLATAHYLKEDLSLFWKQGRTHLKKNLQGLRF